MDSLLINADSVLAVDVGSGTTRVNLFDVVAGCYRFVAMGQSASTAAAPYKDIGEGVMRAIENLQANTGRNFLNPERSVIIPSHDGAGVDSIVATISCGQAIKTMVVGVLNDVSLRSVTRLARSTYTRLVESVGLNDRRKPEAQIDAILRLEPDLVLMAGGTDGGAARSVQKMVDILGLACHLLPAEQRPAILYAGNQSTAKEVGNSLQPLSSAFHVSPNIRPSLDVENLQPASRELASMVINLRKNQFGGVEDLDNLSGRTMLPTAYAFGRLIRFMSQAYSTKKGVLGVDVGESATTLVAGFQGDIRLGVYTQFGLGENLPGLLKHTGLEDILNWMTLDVPPAYVRDYLLHKAIYPNTLPATLEDMAVEQALVRQVLCLAVKALRADMPARSKKLNIGGLPCFEPIMVCGSAITSAPTPGQGLLMLLDGIQPVGVTTVIFDHHHMLPGLGASAAKHPLLPVQILDSGVFNSVAHVVTPVSNSRVGEVILNGQFRSPDGKGSRFEVKQGSLDILPVPAGKSGRLQLTPLHRTDVGFGPGRPGEVMIGSTQLGVVLDARGRPLQLSRDAGQRREILKKWLWTLGG